MLRRVPSASMAAEPRSPLGLALDRVGDRWSLLVVESLLDGPRRFGEIADAVGGIAPNILAARLRRLEQAGIVVARPYEHRPVRLEYGLSVDGRELASAIRLLADWGGRHGDASEAARHDVCGTPLEARWWCPTCREALEEPPGEGSGGTVRL
ncbi:MAG: helix-turn-helix transcriptional regulator [Chloroflexi bacterium]|nr:helix-turn-helix transcriptional regulator [Chloroflexota bacterium]